MGPYLGLEVEVGRSLEVEVGRGLVDSLGSLKPAGAAAACRRLIVGLESLQHNRKKTKCLRAFGGD